MTGMRYKMNMTGFAFGNCDELVGFISGKYGSSDFPFSGEAVLRGFFV